MPNFGAVLKSEITRLARKEIRLQVEPLRTMVQQQRKTIAALKSQLVTVERRLGVVAKASAPGARPAAQEEETPRVRFSAERLKTFRERKGLSQGALATLAGVSTQTIYNWESGANRPRPEQIANLAQLRPLGKKALFAKLAAMSQQETPKRTRKAKAKRA